MRQDRWIGVHPLAAFALLMIIAPGATPARDRPAERDGRAEAVSELVSEYAGEAAFLLESRVAEPLSLAVGDFDGDGVPDLVVGYGDGSRGVISLHRGNLEAVYPQPGQPPAGPFLPVARVVATPQRADVIGSGDFDADGSLDLVIGAVGSSTLHLLRGDGRGGFSASRPIALDGELTAMSVGDVNRRDLLADVVVCVDGRDGAHLVVFESPEGAFRGKPERIALAEAIMSVELGDLDRDGLGDICVKTRSEQLLVRGRDRRRPSTAEVRAAVARPQVERSSSVAEHPAVLKSDLDSGQLPGPVVAAVEMRLDRDALPDRVMIVEGEPAPLVSKSLTLSVFTVDTTADDADFATGDGVCDTDDSVGDGPCTLRAAIQQANASPGADVISFAIPGPGPHTIQPLSGLPAITEAVTIDGTTEPDFAGSPIVELDGTYAGTNADGLQLSGAGCSIRGLVINRFDGDGIEVSSGSNVIEGNWIGTDTTGAAAAGNRRSGIAIWSGADNVVGGTTAAARNVISGNNVPGMSYALLVGASGLTATMIQGNYVGTDASGSFAVPNYLGIGIVAGSEATVGGSTAGAGNVVSGNATNGIGIGGPDTVVVGNLIGTDAAGASGIGNGQFGVAIGAANVLVGGTTSAHRNVIAANLRDGVGITGGAAIGARVEGNFIGVAADGVTPLGNSEHGVSLGNSGGGNSVGGTAAGTGNVIANNGYDGVIVHPNDVGISILGNAISGNGEEGIDLDTGFFIHGDGVTANDAGDADTGANNLQNYPVLTGFADGGATIEGTLDSTASTEFRLELFANSACDPSGHGEGGTFLGADTVATDGTGNATFAAAVTTAAGLGSFVTATATDPDGNTSEFSACLQYTADADLWITKDDGVTSVMPGGEVTYTIVAGNAGPDDIPGAVVSDAFSEYLTCTWTCVAAGGASCTAGPASGDIEDTADLPVGGTATYTAVCGVFHAGTGTLSNDASVSPPSGATDPDPDNNTATDEDTLLEIDYGDAPDPSYPTLWASDGARHVLGGGLALGAVVDGDDDGQPTAGADGDDLNWTDDEDGVEFTSLAMIGETADVEVTASGAGLLNAWIDLNGDGDWADAGEQVWTDEALVAGVNALSFAVPASATAGTTYARFRFDSAGGLAPDGLAADGEVEDHALVIRYSRVDLAETGQTISYAAGDDGAFQAGVPWPDPRFADNGDGTLTDRLTGLMWTQDNVNPGPALCNPGVTRNWFLSLTYVACLNANSYLGYSDWRMPNMVELNSLVHAQVADQRPWWQSQGFTSTTNYRWWSSTNQPDSLGTAWNLSAFAVNSLYGKLAVTGTAVWPVRDDPDGGAVELAATGQVRCWDDSYVEVPCAGTGQDGDLQAGAAWPSPRFEVDGDCVSDRLTGLTWTRDANPFGTRSWHDALQDALDLELCGHDDWRLPSLVELRTLLHYDRPTGSYPDSLYVWWESQGFTNVSTAPPWSGTSAATGPTVGAWTLFSTWGKEDDEEAIVWPVRGNMQTDPADLAVAISDSADPVVPGANVVYTVEVSNLGPNAADEVQATVELPDGAVFVDASGSGWACGEDAGVVTCTVAALGVGSAPPIGVEITTPVAPGATLECTTVVDSLRDDPAGENNGAVETTVEYGYDYGDAPDPTYPTFLVSDGARHVISSTLRLGAAVDHDDDGQPTAGADGDDLDGTDDEDGVVLPASLLAGATEQVQVTASAPGLLDAWVDFNADGDWSDAGEQVLTDEAVIAGVNDLDVDVPLDATTGTTFARFRISSAGGLGPVGLAADGEVEDHALVIAPSAELEVRIADTPDPVPQGGQLTYFLTVVNNGQLGATGVTLTYTLPPEVTFSSSDPGAPTCAESGGVVTCTVGALAAGASVPVEVVADVSPAALGTITSSASVALDQTDPVPANDSAVEESTVMDVLIYIFADNFETGDVNAWSGVFR